MLRDMTDDNDLPDSDDKIYPFWFTPSNGSPILDTQASSVLLQRSTRQQQPSSSCYLCDSVIRWESRNEGHGLSSMKQLRVIIMVARNPSLGLQAHMCKCWYFMKWTSCLCRYTDMSCLLCKQLYCLLRLFFVVWI